MAKSSAMGSTKAINDSSEIATTHVLRAPASIAHVSACYLLHTGRRLASERAGNLPDSTDLGPVQSVAIRCFDTRDLPVTSRASSAGLISMRSIASRALAFRLRPKPPAVAPLHVKWTESNP